MPGPIARSFLRAIVAVVLIFPLQASAQLRPLEPVEWSIFESGARAVASVGGAVYPRLSASLPASRGRLVELGILDAAVRFDRVAIEASGTVRRSFHCGSPLGTPAPGTRPCASESRKGVGAFTIGTLLRLTDEGAPLTGVLRFGTRIPTTDNTTGLGRDQTDFYALLGGRFRSGGLTVSTELGVGLNGTRHPEIEQADVLLYTGQVEYRIGRVVPMLAVVGQQNGFDGWRIRGTEDLAEARAGVRLGGAAWLELWYVHGMEEYGPESGLILGAGIRR